MSYLYGSLRRLGPLFFVSVLVFSACKKDRTEADKEALLKDSVYLYTKEVYLWQEVLPANFHARSYSAAEDVLEALKACKRDENGKAVDRYSFLDRAGAVSEEIEDGVQTDFGFDVRYQNGTDLRIKYVYEGSPAWKAGIRRGWRIVKINGNANIGADLLKVNDYRFLFQALAADHISLTFQGGDGAQLEMRLDKSRYAINPVLCTRVFEKAGRKVGYFAYNSFVAPYKEQTPTTAKTKIDEVFRYFQEEGVSELIVDLRYNGGGSVSAAEYLTNLLVPSGNNGKIMYSYRLNPTLTSYTRKDESWKKAFQTVMVNKTNGTYYPVKVYFIVTKSTASASELLINNLKPYIDVILIGSDFTYGKPVGFFPISILNTDLYAVSFETLNSKGEGEYYGGLRTDKVQAEDLTRDWGDERESCLAQALFHVQYGTFKNEAAAVAGRSRTGPAAAGIYNIFLDRRGNKNMYMLDKGLRVPR